MKQETTFLKITGICGMIAGLITLSIWLLPLFYGRPISLEARLFLYNNPLFQIRLWLSFINIFFVLFMCMGFTIKKIKTAPALAITGMLFFIIYGVVELIGRSAMIFVREHQWSAQIQTETEPVVRETLIRSIRSFDEIWGSLFFLLLICFFIGSVFFGLAMRKGIGLERCVKIALFSAAALALVVLGSFVFKLSFLRTVSRWGYPIIQPLSRFLIGFWIFSEAKNPTKVQ